MATSPVRAARLDVGEGQRLLSVGVPGKITEKEFNVLGRSIYEQIKKLTGCPCLSGVISVVLHDQFKDTVKVNLKTPG
jgi:hypothetical protein